MSDAHGRPHAPPLLRPVGSSTIPAAGSLGALSRGRDRCHHRVAQPDDVRASSRHRADVSRLSRRRARLYVREQHFPIMHLSPSAATSMSATARSRRSLFDGFVESKRAGAPARALRGSLRSMLPWLIDDVEEIDDVFGGDAFPYGIEANRPTLQALVAYMVEQHFIARPIPIEDLFVPLAGALVT